MSKIFPKQQPMIPYGKTALGGIALVLLLFFCPGCGDSPEKYMRDNINLLNEMADVLETIDSKEAAEAARPRLRELKTRSNELGERAEKLKMKELPEGKREALDDKFQQEMKKAEKRQADAKQKTAPLFTTLLISELGK